MATPVAYFGLSGMVQKSFVDGGASVGKYPMLTVRPQFDLELGSDTLNLRVRRSKAAYKSGSTRSQSLSYWGYSQYVGVLTVARDTATLSKGAHQLAV